METEDVQLPITRNELSLLIGVLCYAEFEFINGKFGKTNTEAARTLAANCGNLISKLRKYEHGDRTGNVVKR